MKYISCMVLAIIMCSEAFAQGLVRDVYGNLYNVPTANVVTYDHYVVPRVVSVPVVPIVPIAPVTFIYPQYYYNYGTPVINYDDRVWCRRVWGHSNYYQNYSHYYRYNY